MECVPTEKHNPTAKERDERIGPFNVDPEEALEAILKVDPKSKPATNKPRQVE